MKKATLLLVLLILVVGLTPASLNAVLLQVWVRLRQLVTRPDDQVVGNLSQQDQHFLSLEKPLVATRKAQALLVSSILGFDSATP